MYNIETEKTIIMLDFCVLSEHSKPSSLAKQLVASQLSSGLIDDDSIKYGEVPMFGEIDSQVAKECDDRFGFPEFALVGSLSFVGLYFITLGLVELAEETGATQALSQLFSPR